MKNFIKVIDAYDIEKVINIDFIQSLYKDEDYTIIRFSKDDCIYVKDSYEELSRKLLKLPSEKNRLHVRQDEVKNHPFSCTSPERWLLSLHLISK